MTQNTFWLLLLLQEVKLCKKTCSVYNSLRKADEQTAKLDRYLTVALLIW